MKAFRFSLFRSLSSLSHQSHLIKHNKTIQQLGKLGLLIEARHRFDTMPQRDSITWTSIISAYCNNGNLHDAQTLFNACEVKNVHTWTALLSGYAKNGRLSKAKVIFDSMPERNVVSWNAMVNGYVQNGDLRKARELFDVMPERNVASWNSMITGYCKGGFMRDACELFNRMGERNSVSWLVMISGYVDIYEFIEGWGMFLRMLRCGMMPDQGTLVAGLSAVSGLDNLVLVGNLRMLVLKTGYEGDVVVGNAILNAYTRNGSLGDAYKFFVQMSEKSEYTWTTMIAAFSQCGRLDDAVLLYECVPEKSVAVRATMIAAYAREGRISNARNIFDGISNPDVVAWNAMVAAYSQNGMLEDAADMFLRIPARNVASWAAMIAGLVQNARTREALCLFAELHRSGTLPSHSCLTTVLSACARAGDVEMGRQIHSLTIKMRCQYNSYVGNGLISVYSKCKSTEDLFQVFNSMKVKDTVSWNSLITGFSQNLMLDDARSIFQKMPKRDVMSWTAMVSAYVEAGEEDIGLGLFVDMLRVGIRPEESTLTISLSACGSCGAYELGKQIHALVFKLGSGSFLEVCDALISLYFKCGMWDALAIFKEIPVRDIMTWNTFLSECSQNVFGHQDIRLYHQRHAAEI